MLKRKMKQAARSGALKDRFMHDKVARGCGSKGLPLTSAFVKNGTLAKSA